MPSLNHVAADQVPPHQLHAAFGAAFADYLIGPFTLPLAQWPDFLARQGVDLGHSRVALERGAVAAFALVAPRPALGRWRLATMGALPAARGSGAAPALLDDFIARAAAQGLPGVELEVFAQNPRAVALYRGRGFEVRHALHGHDGPPPANAAPPATAPADAPDAVDLAAARCWLDAAALAIGDLPLQVTGTALAAVTTPLQAWRRGTAQIVFATAADGAITVHSLVDRDPRQHDAQALVAALLGRHPGCAVRVPALQRDDLGGAALRRAGFRPQPLHQWLMVRPGCVTARGPMPPSAGAPAARRPGP